MPFDALPLPRRTGAFVIALAALLLAGCAGSPPEAADVPPEKSETPELFSRVFVESPRRADHGALIGYVGEAELRVGDEEFHVTRLYDENFRTVGFWLENGATYKLRTGTSGEQVEDFLGNHEPAESIARISGVPGPYRMERGL